MSGETVYSKAADLIRENGWFNGSDGNSRRSCIAIAVSDIVDANENVADEAAALRSISAHLGLTGEPWVAIPAWNDAPERTVEDVLLVLKELHVEAGGA